MLVFTRTVEEGFWIGDRIFVKVLMIGRRRVKVGIEAPADYNIVRSEIRGGVADQGERGAREPSYQPETIAVLVEKVVAAEEHVI